MKVDFIRRGDPSREYMVFKTSQNEWTVSRLREFLIEAHKSGRVSDIYLEHDAYVIANLSGKVGEVMFKTNGDLYDRVRLHSDTLNAFYDDVDCKAGEVTKLKRSATGNLKIYTPSDGCLNFRMEAVRRSGNSFGESFCACLRPLKPVVPFSKLDVSEESKKAIEIEKGIVFVTGSTGTGKSTFVSSLLRQRAESVPDMIVTAEDPIEYHLESENYIGQIKQFDISDIAGGFQELLGSFLRFHPNVILIGEMRDPESVRVGLRSVQANHQVFTTTHAERPWHVHERVLSEMPFAERTTIFSDLIANTSGIISQDLLKTKKGALAIQDVMFFTEGDRDSLAEAMRTSFRVNGDYSGYRVRFQEIFDQKCTSGEALSMMMHLERHLENGLIDNEEFKEFSFKVSNIV